MLKVKDKTGKVIGVLKDEDDSLELKKKEPQKEKEDEEVVPSK